MQIGLLGAVFLVLLVLKLTAVIAISWWWVFAPLILGFGILVFVLAALVLGWIVIQ